MTADRNRRTLPDTAHIRQGESGQPGAQPISFMNRNGRFDSEHSLEFPAAPTDSRPMAEPSSHMLMHRIDPRRNMQRFYAMSVQPNLFGGASLVRSWGRIGTSGRQKVDLFEDHEAAAGALDRLVRIRLRRGYIIHAAGR